MLNLCAPSEGEFEEKKSRFLAFLVAFDDFESTMETLRTEHKKANHFVWAFRRMNEQGRVEEGSSDDGEPSGTSGPPCLRVLQGYELIDAAVIVVRFFGGTKLGTGGLVKAYTEATRTAILNARTEPFIRQYEASFFVPFREISHLEYLVSRHKVTTLDRQFGAEGAEVSLKGSLENLNAVLGALGETLHDPDEPG